MIKTKIKVKMNRHLYRLQEYIWNSCKYYFDTIQYRE